MYTLKDMFAVKDKLPKNWAINAYGDDIEILQLVGHGIAMGNASDKVKESANYVTDTVNNEGTVKTFKKYLNI